MPFLGNTKLFSRSPAKQKDAKKNKSNGKINKVVEEEEINNNATDTNGNVSNSGQVNGQNDINGPLNGQQNGNDIDNGHNDTTGSSNGLQVSSTTAAPVRRVYDFAPDHNGNDDELEYIDGDPKLQLQAEEDGFAEASNMLNCALQQLDSIITSKHGERQQYQQQQNMSNGCNGAQATTDATEAHSTDKINVNGTTNGIASEQASSNGVATTNGKGNSDSDHSTETLSNTSEGSRQSHQLSTVRCVEYLVEQLQQSTGNDVQRPSLDHIRLLLNWLVPQHESPSPSMSTVSCPEYGELQERLHRLMNDRESLCLQVSVLTEQVGAQSDKIKDLESLLENKRHKLDSTEEMLQEEMVQRTSLESSKLDLMADVSNLKLQFAGLERNKLETEHKLRCAQAEINHLQRLMQSKMQQSPQQQGGSAGTGSQPDMYKNPPPTPATPSSNSQAVAVAVSTAATAGMDPAEFASVVEKLRYRSDEIDSLRQAVQQLITANADKDYQIEALRQAVEGRGVCSPMQRSVSSYQQPSTTEPDVSSQLRKLLTEDDSFESYAAGQTPVSVSGAPPAPAPPNSMALNSSSSYTSSLSALSANTWSSHATTMSNGAPSSARSLSNGQPGGGGGVMQTSSTSTITPAGPLAYSGTAGYQPPTLLPTSYPTASTPTMARQLAAELDELRRLGGQEQTSTPVQPHPSYSTASLPRNLGMANKTLSSLTLPTNMQPASHRITAATSYGAGVDDNTGGVMLVSSSSQSAISTGRRGRPPKPPGSKAKGGWPWLKRAASKRSTSVPNLAESDDETLRSARTFNQKFRRDRKQRSFRDLIGKLKRSGSQDMTARSRRASSEVDASRSSGSLTRVNGVLSVAGSSMQPLPLRPPYDMFVTWDRQQCAQWMRQHGLGMYATHALNVIKSGRHLITMTADSVEKDLGIKNQLHRKKLRICLRAIEDNVHDVSMKMDYHQVLRWLDDIGLPQYRDAFAEHLVDGPMLAALTVDDLLYMKITSAMHQATLSRGVHILRQTAYNLNRLIRKFDAVSRLTLTNEAIQHGNCGSLVQLWSQHCVSEWLRTIDLTEFTPNLMCAGVTGALMVLEPTFTAESLADVLQMPSSKTLLRRHLQTHFNQLIGADIIAAKRAALAQPYTSQLTPNMRVKPMKKGFSLVRKRNKSEVYLEPEEVLGAAGLPSQQQHNGNGTPLHGTQFPDKRQLSVPPLSSLDNLESSNV